MSMCTLLLTRQGKSGGRSNERLICNEIFKRPSPGLFISIIVSGTALVGAIVLQSANSVNHIIQCPPSSAVDRFDAVFLEYGFGAAAPAA